jgi:poly-gamma-glutamate synthesis protein (capsule biosynthesis protein)
LRLIAVGDIVLTRPWLAAPVDPDFQLVLDFVRDADVAFADLETVMSSNGYPREKLVTLRADPTLVGDLKALGFGILALANNHLVDFGEQALLDTIELLEDNGMRTVGAGTNLEESLRPAVMTVAGGTTIGFLACTALLPVGSAAGTSRPGLAPLHIHTQFDVDPYYQMEEPGNPPRVRTTPDEDDLARVVSAIESLRPTVDFVAVSVHMGYGFGEALAEYERTASHAMIDAGADAVLGNHVHAIHGVECYRGRAILYSPGNFVAQQPRENEPPEVLAIYDQMSKDAFVARLEIESGGGGRVEILPIIMNDDGLPVVARDENFERISERIVRLSGLLGARASRDDGIIIIETSHEDRNT